MAANNAINNNAVSWLGPSYVGVNYVKVYQNISSGSNVVLYTCPSGKRAYATNVMVHNSTAGTITGLFYIRVSGVDYQLGLGNAISANSSVGNSVSSGNGWNEVNIILEPNESLVFNGNGLNVFMTMFEYSDNVPVFTKKIINSANTDNTLYTVPANKISMLGVQTTHKNAVNWYNAGATATATCYFVDSGNSPSASYIVGTGSSPAFLMLSSIGISSYLQGSAVLTAGDFVQVNLSAVRNGIMWANIWETDL